MLDFLNAIKISATGGEHYAYLVATFGGSPGNISLDAEAAFKKFGLNLSASFGVKMVDNWTPYFDLTGKNYVQSAESEVEPQTQAVVAQIVSKAAAKIPPAISNEVYTERRAFYETLRHTEKFTVSEKCVGCGQCARQCPLSVIKIENRRPVWAKKMCTLCLGCLHVCPKKAINFDGKTERRGQYHNPRVKKII